MRRYVLRAALPPPPRRSERYRLTDRRDLPWYGWTLAELAVEFAKQDLVLVPPAPGAR